MAKEPENTFVNEVAEAGYTVEPYAGRFYWRGPAVRFDSDKELIELIRSTTVNVQWEAPMFYPANDDSTWYEWAESEVSDSDLECPYCARDHGYEINGPGDCPDL